VRVSATHGQERVYTGVVSIGSPAHVEARHLNIGWNPSSSSEGGGSEELRLGPGRRLVAALMSKVFRGTNVAGFDPI